MRVVTFGTFDMFHIGHLRILTRAARLGDHLAVGLSTDELNLKKKGRRPVYDYASRRELLLALRCVDVVFPEESLEAKRDYLIEHEAGILVMGDDWEGRFDGLRDVCDVVYLPRTPSISTTETIEKVRGLAVRPPEEDSPISMDGWAPDEVN